MAGIITVLWENVRPYKYIIFFIIIAAILGAIGWFVYNRFFKPTLITQEKGYDDIPNRSKKNTDVVKFFCFSGNYCPHCKKMRPQWDEFVKEHNGKTLHGKKIVCQTVEVTDESNEDLVQKFGIQSVPTIKCEVGDTVYDYEGKITKANLEEFVNTL